MIDRTHQNDGQNWISWRLWQNGAVKRNEWAASGQAKAEMDKDRERILGFL